MKAVHIIGVPLDLGGGRRGVDMGPSAFRIAGIGERIGSLGYTVADRGDLPAPIPETQELRDERKKYIRDIAKVCQKVYQTSLASFDEGATPKVLPAHTVLVGIRNLDDREKVAVKDSHVHVFTMKDIDRQGIASIVEQAVNLAGSGTAGIHVSFDMDVCDPTIAPGVGTPVKGGLDYREAHMVMEIVADAGLLTSLDLVEVNSTLDVRNATAQLGTELALSALGMKIL